MTSVAPTPGAFLIETQYPVGVVSDEQIEPFSELPDLRQIAAPPDVLEPSSNLADGLYREIEIIDVSYLNELRTPGLAFFPFRASLTTLMSIRYTQVLADS